MEIICVPIITAVVYALIEVYKSTLAKLNEKFLNFIPVVGMVLGVIFGIMFYYLLPDLIASSNLLSAILVGGASGLSATGCNQMFKQLKKYGISVKEADVENVLTEPTNETANETIEPTNQANEIKEPANKANESANEINETDNKIETVTNKTAGKTANSKTESKQNTNTQAVNKNDN